MWQQYVGPMVLRRGRRVVVAAVLVAGGYTVWSALSGGHSIANGDVIYARLTAVQWATPRSATTVQTSLNGARWIPGCSSIANSRSGWTKDYVSVKLQVSVPAAAVISEIDRTLVLEGWQRRDVVLGSLQGKTPHWTLNVHSAGLAQAFAYATPAGSHSWYLSASWSPPGPRGQGCP